MQEKIRNYLNSQFATAPKTKRIEDLKDELYANLCDKYSDALAKGRSEEESFDLAIRTLGDVDELVKRFSNEDSMTPEERKKHAKVLTVCLGLFILAIISSMVLGRYADRFLGMLAFIVIAGVAACIALFHFLSEKSYVKRDDTLAERFKEFEAKQERKEDFIKTISGIYWMSVVAIYLLFSFMFNAWAFSWIIFLLAVIVQSIIKLSLGISKNPGERREQRHIRREDNRLK